MELTIEPGEIIWNPDGTHLIGENGLSVVATEQTVVTFISQEAYDNAIACRAAADEKGCSR